MDEIGTALGTCTNQLVVGTSDTDSTIVKVPNDREWCTAIEAINPFGRSTTPLLIFKAKHVQNQWFIPQHTPDWVYTSSKAAFTINEIGLEWLQEVFLPQIGQGLSNTDWRLLVLDGHASHVSIKFMQLAYLHRVWCYYLLPHASHALQPLDIAVFSPLKRAFRSLVAFENKFDDFEPVKKVTFLLQYERARTHSITPSNCGAGFQAAGIYPWDPQKVLSSSWVLQPPPERPQTPPQPPTIASSRLWDSSKTPRGPQDVQNALYTLGRSIPLPREVRSVIQKTGKALARVNVEYAISQRQLRVSQSILDRQRAKRKKKEPLNPNKTFLALRDIEAGPIPLQRPISVDIVQQPSTTSTERPPEASIVPVNQFLAITGQLQAIRYN